MRSGQFANLMSLRTKCQSVRKLTVSGLMRVSKNVCFCLFVGLFCCPAFSSAPRRDLSGPKIASFSLRLPPPRRAPSWTKSDARQINGLWPCFACSHVSERLFAMYAPSIQDTPAFFRFTNFLGQHEVFSSHRKSLQALLKPVSRTFLSAMKADIKSPSLPARAQRSITCTFKFMCDCGHFFTRFNPASACLANASCSKTVQEKYNGHGCLPAHRCTCHKAQRTT